ncbi:hypothetical protein LX32DRAFT_647274 [Colletotrichum zoysiae]|uniref:Uncharacterized protein n=1 Tax=Colletotrichum zoysiae TaxID=1216348 RepID=A0AAD9H3C7_9PEZI|nr:hypothetical protein LX32DRAFT_647274 [Colletotrichum zoysiae]
MALREIDHCSDSDAETVADPNVDEKLIISEKLSLNNPWFRPPSLQDLNHTQAPDPACEPSTDQLGSCRTGNRRWSWRLQAKQTPTSRLTIITQAASQKPRSRTASRISVPDAPKPVLHRPTKRQGPRVPSTATNPNSRPLNMPGTVDPGRRPRLRRTRYGRLDDRTVINHAKRYGIT